VAPVYEHLVKSAIAWLLLQLHKSNSLSQMNSKGRKRTIENQDGLPPKKRAPDAIFKGLKSQQECNSFQKGGTRRVSKKRFEKSDDHKQFDRALNEVKEFAMKGLQGDSQQGALYDWKMEKRIKIKKTNLPYPKLKQLLKERRAEHATTLAKVKDENMVIAASKPPVIAHKGREYERAKNVALATKKDMTGNKSKFAGILAGKATLNETVGKFSNGTLYLNKRDVSRVFSDNKPRGSHRNNSKEGRRKGTGKRG